MRPRPLLALALLLAGRPAAGQGDEPALRAAPRTGPVALDGRVDEPAWEAAPPFDAFVQNFPDQGVAPTQRTLVRVLYDEDQLYVAVVCLDAEPGAILRALGRRDSPPASDSVQVLIDSNRDGRTAVAFSVNAAGVQSDGLYFDDDQYTGEWDAVWDARAAARADGWSAEIAIPLAALRFDDTPVQRWGFGVQREIGRSHESDATMALPRGARGLASRLGVLEGVEGVRPNGSLELMPYLAARLTLRPQFLDESRPDPRLGAASGDLGVDLRARLGPNVGLAAALNPDFGQVEADRLVLNLTTFEPLFPEKRPFFLQGLDLFQPVGAGREEPSQQLFYSRRIGLDSPILGAAKLVARTTGPWQLAALDAVVMGPGSPPGARESDPDTRLAVHPERPLHAGPDFALPAREPASANYLAAVARFQPSPAAAFGATLTSALPLGPACTDAEVVLPETPALPPGPGRPSPSLAEAPVRPMRCDVRAGHALGLDWNVRSDDGAWGGYGQVAGSWSAGGPPVRVLADGTALRAGDLGYGGFLTAGHLGGEPLRFELQARYASPRLDLNASGYQPTQNSKRVQLAVKWIRPSGGGPFHGYELGLYGTAAWTTDGRDLSRGNAVWGEASATLKDPYLALGCSAGRDDPGLDVREIDRAGLYAAGDALPAMVPLDGPGWLWASCWGQLDGSRPVSGSASASVGRTFERGPMAPVVFGGALAEVVLRPHPRLETRLGVAQEWNHYAVKWIEDRSAAGATAGTYLLGQLYAPALSLTLRQLLVFTPRLTLQLYAQLLTGYGHYERYYEVSSAGQAVGPADLRPVAEAVDHDFHETALNVNLVLRWEYALGSTIYLVYARSQKGLPLGDEPAPTTLRPERLGAGPATDTVLLKWAWYLKP